MSLIPTNEVIDVTEDPMNMRRWRELCGEYGRALREADEHLYAEGAPPTMERMIEYERRMREEVGEIQQQKDKFLADLRRSLER